MVEIPNPRGVGKSGLTGGALGRLHNEAQGVLDIVLLRPKSQESLIRQMQAGDLRSLNLLRGVTRILDDAPICIIPDCQNPVHPELAAVMMAIPYRIDPAHALGGGTCRVHARLSDEELMQAFIAWMRRIWPDLRMVAAPTTEGTA